MLQDSSGLDECLLCFFVHMCKDSDACLYEAAVACYAPMSKCMYMGLSSVNVLYIRDSVESQGSCVHEIAAVM